jgi:MFS family permease
MSELYGRKVPLFTGFTIFAIFNIPVAVAQNLQTIFICRFLGGVFGSAPLAILGGALADLWDPVNRGIAIAVFSASTFIGPTLSPVIGGFITMSYLGWRWTQWITLILAALFGTIGFFVIPESYAPVLLARRAKKLRYETKNWALHAKAEEEPVGIKVIVDKYLLRPFKMMFLEPILVLVTIYMSVIYGIMYLFFSVFPIAFQEYRGWNAGVGALPFLGLIVGVACGAGLITYTSKTKFKQALEREGHVVPEARLPPMMVGAFAFPAGLFWFGWTSDPDITWVPQVISCAFIGMGVLLIFLQGMFIRLRSRTYSC